MFASFRKNARPREITPTSKRSLEPFETRNKESHLDAQYPHPIALNLTKKNKHDRESNRHKPPKKNHDTPLSGNPLAKVKPKTPDLPVAHRPPNDHQPRHQTTHSSRGAINFLSPDDPPPPENNASQRERNANNARKVGRSIGISGPISSIIRSRQPGYRALGYPLNSAREKVRHPSPSPARALALRSRP